MEEEKPRWSPGPCPWGVDRGLEGRRVWCTSWKSSVCPPAKCENKIQAAKDRAREMSAYRIFPGNPFQVETKEKAAAAREAGATDWWKAALPPGHCRWCGGAIWSEKKPGELNRRRSWHPDCAWRHNLHTRAEVQVHYLIGRDGIGCRCCGAPAGRWQYHRVWDDGWKEEAEGLNPDNLVGWRRERYPACTYVAQFTPIWWKPSLEVDHIIALAIVALTISAERRWRFYGPTNIQGLCAACHKVKTREDVAKLKALRLTLPPPAPAPV